VVGLRALNRGQYIGGQKQRAVTSQGRQRQQQQQQQQLGQRQLQPAASMRPTQRIKKAEELARRFRALMSSPIMSQFLQCTPPAALTAEQEAHLSRCCSVIWDMTEALSNAPSLKMQLADAMLKQQVACNIGSVVTWVQQQPEPQLLDSRAVAVAGRQGVAPAGGMIAAVWAAGVHLLERFALVIFAHNSESAGACSMAATLTQQLDQSGKPCSRNCTAQDAVAASMRHPPLLSRIG
jgi:hypothetical protein